MNERELFNAALQIDDLGQRSAYLDGECGSQVELRQRVEALIQAYGQAGSFLQQPAGDPVATLQMPALEKIGMQIGPYKLLEEIGHGGMGLVYMAEQKQPVRRVVAIKVVKPGMDSQQVLARFDAERQALAMMDHPNIARIIDAGMTEMGRPYFVMELVRGIPINEFADKKRLTLQDRLKLFVQVCQAVQHAHQMGIIHRDLKPTNVLVTMLDVQAVPKVIDFGIAKAFGPQLTDHTQVTGFAQFVGTPQYMSPEQAQMNQQGVDTRSDVYSLGVMLYELLTGTTPFDKELLKNTNFEELKRMLREQDPPRPSARISTLDAQALSTVSERRGVDPRRIAISVRGELDWIVMKALEKDRERRYESANALAADVGRYLSGATVQACPPTIGYRWKKMARRNKSLLATGLLIAAVVFIGTTVSIMQAVRATQAEQVAETGLQSERVARAAEQEARQGAEQAKDLAQQNAALAYRQQYRAEMQLGLVDLKAGNLSRLYRSLVDHLPNLGREDRRGWEWYYLLSRCQEGRTLCEHYAEISSLAWSPDGRNLATTSYDGDAIVWDARSGQLVRRFSFGNTLKRGVAWSPDSQRLAWGSVGDENAVRIWDRHTDEIHILYGHSHSLVSCSWSPDGSRLATTSMDTTARIWDTVTWECQHVLRGHKNHVNAACWTADSKSLVTAGGISLNVWDAQSGELTRDFQSEERSIRSASTCTTAPQKLLLCGREKSSEPKFWLIDMDSWEAAITIPAHGSIQAVAVSPGGATFASANSDGGVAIWNVAEGRQLSVLRGHLGRVTSLAWNPNGKQLAAGSADGTVRIWDLPPTTQPVSFSGVDEAVGAIHWSNKDRVLTVVGATSGKRTVWDCVTNTAEQNSIETRTVQQSHSPNGNLNAMLSVDSDGSGFEISIEKLATRDTSHVFQFPLQQDANLRSKAVLIWSHNSQFLAVYNWAHVDVWDVLSGQRAFTWDSPRIAAVTWAPDSRRIAIAGGGDRTDNGTQAYTSHVHVFDVESKERLLKVRIGSERVTTSAVAWDPSGKLIAAGTLSGDTGVWDAETGVQLAIARLHVAPVRSIDWTPDASRVASAGEDGTLKVWDPKSGDELLTLGERNQLLTAVKWSADGARLAAGDQAGRVQFWDASGGHAVASIADQHRALAKMHASRALQSTNKGHLSGALADYSRAIELAPSRPAYRRSRAVILVRQGKLEEAFLDLTAALDLDPDDRMVLLTRLELSAQLEHWPEALGDADKLHELSQAPFDSYQQAVVQLKVGDTEAYRGVSLRQWAGEPDELSDQPEIRAWTSALIPDAIADVERVVPLVQAFAQGRDDTGIMCFGALLYRAGYVDEGVELLINANRAYEQAGSPAEPGSRSDLLPGFTWYFLAMACHDLGRYAESRTWFGKAESYTETILAKPSIFMQTGSINWHQRAVLELLQREARQVLGVKEP